MGITWTHFRFDGNPTLTGYGYEYEKSPTFSIGYVNVYIPAIILIPV